MWEMFDADVDCDECGGPGPPPKFMVPPPPRPPFMQELTKCSEEDGWDFDMCEAIPILDASYHSSPSLQTSAMIAVFSLLLVLVVLISSLFVWKHKRKVQNFLPCKTPTRGGHLSGGVPGGHSVTYEDPDAHLGHRPLVMRHHHNVEMLHPKAIHYPSGYPMTRSPPLFVCSSPGPDPYRSNDNVYEELGPGRDSDGESDPPMHSDDDFAEDELSLPGERSFNKASPDQSAPVATIYHERINTNNLHERNSLISSSSSTTNPDQRNNGVGGGGGGGVVGGILGGVLRQASCGSSRNKSNNTPTTNTSCNNSNKNIATRKLNTFSADDLNTSSEQTGSNDIVPPILFDDRTLMTLQFNNHNLTTTNCNNSINNSSSSNNIINNNNCNNSNDISNRNQCLTTVPSTIATTIPLISSQQPPPPLPPGGVILVDSEVERRNRINNQLHQPPVSTIFRERINYNTSRYPQPYYSHHNLINSQQHHQRSRTNPRSSDRRRIGIPIDHEPTYGYAEPVFHEGLLYDACLAHQNNSNTQPSHTLRTHPYPYILPEFTTFRTLGNTNHHHQIHQQQQQQQQQQQHLLQPQQQQGQIYSRDSSFGSDSGYSQHTQMSGRGGGGGGGGGGGNNSNSSGSASCGRSNSSSGCGGGGLGGVGKIGLNFAWNRRTSKDNNSSNNNNNNNKSKTYENS